MRHLVLALLLLSSGPGWRWLSRVGERNEALARAQAAYRQGNPAGAAAAFRRALEIPTPRPVPDPRLLLNLAHAQAQAGQVAAARATYGQLLSAGRVPARLGSVARQQLAVLRAGQGQYAQALGLLRQALSLDPTNNAARYNYEVLREFLARQPAPQLPSLGAPRAKPPTPPPGAKPPMPEKSPVPAPPNQAPQPQPASRPGADRPGQLPDAAQPGSPSGPPQPRPAANGQPDPARPDVAPGPAAGGGQRPGAGPTRPLPAGAAPGRQRGPNANLNGARPPAGQSSRPGTEPATDADQQLQTQRERLRQLNLTPGQARQLLEALRAQEAQYLQQRPRPAGRRPRPGEPTW
ncbi:tetratricopeptide repeat protein [uncultured Hymenobacter sp.]|uniref:tetratricopeptide repeat protein n=1 Tax=uncultured Hymenobacter sp. TaxID=170016 RepID=UPI0035CAD929